MQLPSHGRCGYSAIVDRPDYSWPEGKRLAIYVAAALEHFAFGRGIGHPEGTAALSKHKDLVAVADRAVTLRADSFYRSNRVRRLLTRHSKTSYSDFREALSARFVSRSRSRDPSSRVHRRREYMHRCNGFGATG